MQTFLLSLASALILAIAAAFAAPFFVDWAQWRSAFEAQAARTIGAPVAIRGPIEAELLPVPRVTLRNVVIGTDPKATGLAAAELRGVFALGPLFQGHFKAEELALVKPKLRLVLGAGGGVVLPSGAARPSDFAITTLSIDDGSAEIADAASGRIFSVETIDLRGEIGGPSGPFKFEGSTRAGGVRRGVRLTLGLIGDTGAGRLRLAVTPPDGQLGAGPNLDLDGVLGLAGGVPTFEGRAGLVGRADPKAQMPIVKAGWTVTSAVRANREAIQFDELGLTLGATQRPIDLSGSGRLALVPSPRLELALSARQIDLDVVTAGTAPLAALAEIVAALTPAAGIAPSATIRLSSDTVLAGGAPLREFRTAFGWSQAGLSISALEAKLPGRSAFRLSGTVPESAATAGLANFSGSIGFESEDPAGFATWAVPNVAGLIDGLPPGTLRLSAGIDASPDRIALNGIDLSLGPARFSGSTAYRPSSEGRPAAAEARLAAQGLDLDPLLPLLRRLPGIGGSGLETALAFDGRAIRLSGLTAERLDVAVKSAAGGLDVERLAITGLGGLDLKGSGRIAPGDIGRFAARLAGTSAEGLPALLRLLGPVGLDAPATRLAPVLAPVDLGLTLDGRSGRTEIAAEGRLGSVKGKGSASLDAAWTLLDGRIGVDVADGSDVIGRLGLPGLRAGLGPARLDAALSPGPGSVPLLDGRLGFAGASFGARGEFRIDDRGVLRPTLDLNLDKADLARLFPTLSTASDQPIPARFTGRLGRQDDAGWRIDDLNGTLAGVALSGALAYAPAPAEPFDAQLRADRLSLTRLLGLGVGMATGAGPWPDGRFGTPPLADVAARLSLAADTIDLPGGLALAQGRLRLRLGTAGTVVEDVTGQLAGGRFSGSAILRRRGELLEASGHAALSGADLSSLVAAAGVKQGIRGRGTVVLDLSGSGRTPAALAQSFAGQGSLAVEDFQLAGFDPRSLQYVMLGTERGAPPDGRRLTQLFDQALARGPLVLPRIETPLSVLNGVARTGAARVALGSLRVTASGGLDLARLSFDASIELEDGADARSSAIPGASVSWRGPIGTPERRSDVTALSAAINLRALERETRRLEAEYGRSPPPITDAGRGPPTMDAGSSTAPERPPLPPPAPAQIPAPSGAAVDPPAVRPQTQQRPRTPPPASTARPAEPDRPAPAPRIETAPLPELRPPAEIPVNP